MARVEHVFLAVVHRQPVREVEEARAIPERGLGGCIHGRPGSRRQVLLMDAETLEELGIPAGAVRENLTIRGLKLRELKAGQRLRVGEAIVELTMPCEPCGRMEEIRAGLKAALRGRRGMLCRVVGEGRIRRGDAIEVIDAASTGS